ncbi:chromatin assembly factor 1 subunit B [Plasmodium vinckei petteri]|uniref:Protein HIRA n=1 Tax=Plasmodium vinckei petteri TaxID=138298 RepID=W7AX01_PLAVN|nr:chromatin assembly factor 1 subunit B [Plasmodium vinckei petteri]CAD2108044.1 chromosome assembly factor 1, putative [Plasmodium vinckei petteri]
MPHVYLPQILWHSKDNKRSDRIYSVDIQPYPNYYSVKKLHKKYERFKTFLKDKENKYEINHFDQNIEDNEHNTISPSDDNKNGSLKIDKSINSVNKNNSNHTINNIYQNSSVNKNNHLSNDISNGDNDNENCSQSKYSFNNATPKISVDKDTHSQRKKAIKLNIATCGADEFVHIWRVYINENLTVRCLSRFIGHNGEINCVRFNKNGRYLASGGEDKFLYIWEKSKKPKNIPLGYDASFLDYKEWWNIVGSFRCSGVINSITWSDNDTLYIGNEDNNINIIEFVKNSSCKVKVLEGHTGIIQGISLDINSEILASLSADQTLKIWKKKVDGKSWKLENSIKNIKTDQLEKKSTSYISYNEYEYNEKNTEKNDYNNSYKKEEKQSLENTNNHSNTSPNDDKERRDQFLLEKNKIEEYDENKKMFFKKKDEHTEEDHEEEEEEKKLKRCLFSSEEMLPSFFRRIDFSPSGDYLIAPSGIQFEQVEKNNKNDDNTKTNYQIKAYSCFYIYHKNLFIKYNIPFFTVFSQTSHFLVAKFNYNTYKLRTQENIFKKCYKHLLENCLDTENESNQPSKKRKSFEESSLLVELKNHNHLLKLNYEKTLLFNDKEVQNNECDNISSTISDISDQSDYTNESVKDYPSDYPLSNNADNSGEPKTIKSEFEDAEMEEDEEDKDGEEKDVENDNTKDEAKEEETKKIEKKADDSKNQSPNNDHNKSNNIDTINEDKQNDLDALCENKDKKEERYIYALGTFDGSVYFYDSEILDMPFSIVKNIHLCPITDISWNNLGNICACSSSDGYVSFYYFDKKELGNVKSYKNYYFGKKCNDLTFDDNYFENIYYDEVNFLNKDELNDYTSSEDESDGEISQSNKDEPKVRRINLIVGNAANYILAQNGKK